MKVSDHLDRSSFQGVVRANPIVHALRENGKRATGTAKRGGSQRDCFNFDERKKTTGVSFAHRKTIAHVAESDSIFGLGLLTALS